MFRPHTICSLLLPVLLLYLTACVKTAPPEEPVPIPTPIPAASNFAKIEIGWTQKQVWEAIGKPTDARNYIWPDDAAKSRIEALYKGEGTLFYTGKQGEEGPERFTVQRIIYNPEESGYTDKTAHPDGPQNPVKEKPAPKRPAKPKKRDKPDPKLDELLQGL